MSNDPIGPEPRKPSEDLVAVLRFAADMVAKLEANRSKAHWSTATYGYLLSRLEDELRELGDAMRSADKGPGDVIAECADVANFAMMIADNVRREAADPHEEL